MRFKLKSGEPFTFAGLWDSWKQPDGTMCCAGFTTECPPC